MSHNCITPWPLMMIRVPLLILNLLILLVAEKLVKNLLLGCFVLFLLNACMYKIIMTLGTSMRESHFTYFMGITC